MAEERKPEQSVFLITSGQRDNNTHGTGFVIRREGGKTWVLTCRHVVRDAGGEEHVRVNRLPATRVVMKDRGPEDLAVLEVEGLDDVPVLELKAGGKQGDSIKAAGFSLFDAREGRYAIKPVGGALGKPGGQEVGDAPGRVDTWDLNVSGDDHLKPGYSGSPVIDAGDGKVIGVVSHMLGKGKESDKGVAVFIDALLAVWPEAPPELIQSAAEKPIDPPEEKTEPTATDRPGKKQQNYGDLLALLCNREEHDDLFEDEFTKFCADKACKNAPQFFIVHGDAGEAHRSLVTRLVKTHILAYARERLAREARSNRDAEALFEIKPKWVAKKDLADHKKALQRRLINFVHRSYTHRDYSLKRFLELPHIDKYGVILVHHYIGPDDWTAHCRDLLKWYMTEYWRPGPADTDRLFIIFFCIEYPKVEPVKKWSLFPDRRRKARETIRTQLTGLADEVKKSCRCVLIDELGPVTREQAAEWFREYTDYNDFEIEEKIQAMFGDAETLPMSVVEHRLQEVADKINDQAFQQHIGGNPL